MPTHLCSLAWLHAWGRKASAASLHYQRVLMRHKGACAGDGVDFGCDDGINDYLGFCTIILSGILRSLRGRATGAVMVSARSPCGEYDNIPVSCRTRGQ